jgi:hypothetical protein
VTAVLAAIRAFTRQERSGLPTPAAAPPEFTTVRRLGECSRSALVVAAAALPLSIAILGVPSDSAAQSVTLHAPAEVTVGAPIEITWEGSVGKTDFISVDEEGAPDRTYGEYIYPSKGPPGVLKAPDIPGNYVLRYHSGESGYAVLGSRHIRVTDTAATFVPPGPVDAGEKVSIEWEGPGHPQDFISVDKPGSEDRVYGHYAYAKESPVTIQTPDDAGNYVVRYHMGGSYRVIGEVALVVGGVTAELMAPSQVQAGSEIEVAWKGPANPTDYISIDPAGAPDGEYLEYTYTARGNPLTVRVPEAPGSYAVRYHMGQSRTVLASSPLKVLPNTAAVSGPKSVVAGEEFRVEWTGPDNRSDYITIVRAGADPREYEDYAYTREGTPVELEAPFDSGTYELRYLTGSTRQVLATAPIEVSPGAVPGTLRVLGPGANGTAAPAAVEVILDASGSMLKRLGGERRIEIAKQALAGLVERVIPEGTRFALRVFGHKEADSCRTDLEIAAAPLARSAAVRTIQGIDALNLARTPIAASLFAVKTDLAGTTGPVTVVLVTDGEETCEGDPMAAIQELQKSGFDVRVNIVGFAIDEQLLAEQFASWARVGNGRYVEANDGAQLAAAMGQSLETPFEVLRDDEVVATGTVGGDPVRLMPGTYRVRLPGSADARVTDVTVEPAGDHVVEVR